jgi:cellobiose phosphorylase
MYRVAVESIVGVRRQAGTLMIDPCVPRDWTDFGVDYRWGASVYSVTVKNPAKVSVGVRRVSVDGALVPGLGILLVDDGQKHEVIVEMGTPDEKAPG